MNPTMIALVSGLGVEALAVVALALRLWHQAKRDRHRQDVLSQLTKCLPSAGTLELHDLRDDGSQLRLRITRDGDV
ncbi:hypothetical protein ABZ345_11695 [Lentzea sp. NPDC005914]|uniref:hypothetical protein n=1 Tax=Lentzea sp. NPDC005914 TaxID=3154572 RepID=UPI0033CE9281